jgi:hypothetical protein
MTRLNPLHRIKTAWLYLPCIFEHHLGELKWYRLIFLANDERRGHVPPCSISRHAPENPNTLWTGFRSPLGGFVIGEIAEEVALGVF